MFMVFLSKLGWTMSCEAETVSEQWWSPAAVRARLWRWMSRA